MKKRAILILVLVLLALAAVVWQRSRSCTQDGAFTVNGYVPVQCGPFKPGERVDIKAQGEDGSTLDAGWPQGMPADSTGVLRTFVTTIGWSPGRATVTCTGRESGKSHRVSFPVTADFEGAIRLASDVYPAKVSLSQVGDAGVYVRVAENGFQPAEDVALTVEGPDGKPFSLSGQADWAGNVVFVLRVDRGDLPGRWRGVMRGEKSGTKRRFEYRVSK